MDADSTPPHPTSPRRLRGWPLRSSLLIGAVVVTLGTVPVLVPLLVTRSGEAAQADSIPVAVTSTAPALSQAAVATEPSSAAGSTGPRTTAPAGPTAGSLASAEPSPEPTGPASASARVTAAAGTTPVAPPPARPDLVVTSVSWSPRKPRAGDALLFSAVVRNEGTAATAVGPDVAFFVDGAKVSWAAGGGSLAAGARRTVTASAGQAGSSWTAAVGTHTVVAQVDGAGRIPEVDEGNNTATATLTVG
ncbi:MAG TPA: CARDB domain-containing protein [Mycobacteriales bacterium]|nr:CARDB domain-containing protein [Mycobacteriales bacterium]